VVAEKYAVSRAWVDRLKQRRRETGEIAPRRQTRWRTPLLHAQLPRLAILIREQPDRTLAELQQALPTSASLATIWRAVTQLGFRLKKNGPRRRTRPSGRGGRAGGVAAGGVDVGSRAAGVSG
jgi:transposase